MNEYTLRMWFDVFKDNNELVEIRILDPETKRSYSGYFTDIETILREIKRYEKCNLYFTLNVIDPACYSREQHDRISTRPKSTTSDVEILGRKWCLIDVDCEKPSDTNSTDEEKELAKDVVNNVYKFLRDEGFEQPVICDSANGFHLLYKQAMKNTAENTETMKNFLKVLDMYFSTDKVKIDCSTFNPSRICKLYGVISRKGSNTKERPQRESKILRVPQEIKITSNEYFEKVASYLPQPEKRDRSNNYGDTSFDLDEFIQKYGIRVRNKVESRDYTKYVLETCPFNPSHTAPDSAIFKMRDGSYGFKCLHNSCSQYTFKDFRLHYDSNAYNGKDYREFKYKERYYGALPKETFTPVEETEEKGKKWLTSKDIKRKTENEIIAIPTGYAYLDKAIRGLILGEVTILSGLNGSGKSSWLNSVMLNVINRGFKVACFSGELTDYNVMKWLAQSAAGKNYVHKVEGSDYSYEVHDMAYEKIADWLYEKFYLFNNNYGNKFEQVISDLEEVVKKGVQLIVIDNLMALQISGLSGDKNEKQKQFILDIVEFAKKKNVHVVVVCHPRKESGSQTLLRKESIAGSSDLSNAVQNVAIVHRCGEDFCKRASEFFGKDKAERYMEYSNVVEICKNRSYGVVDYLVGMYYEVETKRFKNSVAEHIIYGWQDKPRQVSFDEYTSMDLGEELDDAPF
jgi:KaiC/GvpD/RAD55 family RecA-like ATPase